MTEPIKINLDPPFKEKADQLQRFINVELEQAFMRPNTIEEKQAKINQWLRRHTEYQVIVKLCDLYGCVSIRVLKDYREVYISWGATLEKRLDEVIKFLKIDEEDGIKAPPELLRYDVEWQQLRSWLRDHPGYEAIYSNSITGLCSIALKFKEKEIFSAFGNPPEMQLESVLAFLKTYKPEDEPKKYASVPDYSAGYYAIRDLQERVKKLEEEIKKPREVYRPLQKSDLDTIYKDVARRFMLDLHTGIGG